MNALSPFHHAEPYAGDPILTLHSDYLADPRVHKINLAIGVYTDATGCLPVLDCVREASRDLWPQAQPYLPMQGDAALCEGMERLVFGDNHPARTAGRLVSIQTLGCTGALAMAADLLHALDPHRLVFISRPGWDNHHGLFRRAGFSTVDYPWCNASGTTLAWTDMTQLLAAAPEGSVIVMQASGHNPTGLDMTQRQFARLADIVRARGHLVIFDLAYQGFVAGMDEDAALIRTFSRDQPCLVATSFSKNFSLYGERVGGLSAVCANQDEGQRVLGQMKLAVRRAYSSPPTSGARIVARVLADPVLHARWRAEVDAMRDRMQAMRRGLADRLESLGTSAAAIRCQAGMFAWTGLPPDAVERLRRDHAVYLLDSGRLCVAGLNAGNLDRVARILVPVMA